MAKTWKLKWFCITWHLEFRRYEFISLKTCYKILSLILPVFINSNLELFQCFVHFRSAYGETLYACALSWIHRRNWKKLNFPKIKEYKASFCPIVSEVSRINFWLGGLSTSLPVLFRPAAALADTIHLRAKQDGVQFCFSYGRITSF